MKNKIIVTIVVLLIILGILSFAVYGCSLDELNISGCTYYTKEEFEGLIKDERLPGNTIYQYLHIRSEKEENIPFIEEMEVSLVSLHKINVTVYEKKIIGCIPYMGEYICFDKDGVMVGSVLEKREDILFVTGIDYKKMIYNETVDTEQKDIFDVILNIAQLVDKNKIRVERVDIDSEREITLYLGDIKVKLGKHDQYDEPLAALPGILKGTEGLKGTLNMENYTEGNTEVIFVKDGD